MTYLRTFSLRSLRVLNSTRGHTAEHFAICSAREL